MRYGLGDDERQGETEGRAASLDAVDFDLPTLRVVTM
jgi:hypothetical protein